MFHPIEKWNVRLGNALYVDLKITWPQNVQSKYFFNEKGNPAWDIGEDNSDCEIYASMTRMSNNEEWKIHGKTENWDKTLVQERW